MQENECFSNEIRTMEKKLLRILKDKTFLLDVLMQVQHMILCFSIY